MRILFAVLFLTVAFVASYPSYREAATENEDNDLELELRSILNYLDNEKTERSLNSEEDNDDEEYEMSKRQGGHNVVDKQSKCEIECIFKQRNPSSGKGKTVKDAAKVCKGLCPVSNNKRAQKKQVAKPKPKLSLREFTEDDSNSSEEQQIQRRELYNYLMEQLQQNNDE